MYTDILLTVDLGHESSWEKALPIAVEYAKTFGCKLHVMTVVPDFGMSIVGSFFPEGYETKVISKAQQELSDFCAKNMPPDIAVQHVIGHGVVYEEILRVAAEIKPDLIIMASHRPELKDYLIGPNADRVARHANCSVQVVRN